VAEAAAPTYPLFRCSALRLALALLRFLWVLSFAVTIVNPALSGRTLYLYLLLPALDLQFLHQLLNFRATWRRIACFCALLFLTMLSLHDLVFTVKFLLVLFQVIYLFFLSSRNLAHYLFLTLVAHILVALLQMGFFFLRPDLLLYVTPGYLAGLIWGDTLATATFANFGFEFLLPRFSGLYRESAFFASYLMGLYLFFVQEQNYRYRKAAFFLIFLGIMLSFSKISAAILIIIFINNTRRYLDKVPLYVSTIVYLVVFSFIANYAFDKIFSSNAYDAIGSNISMMHRFLSYYGLQFFDPWNLLLGLGDYPVLAGPLRGIVDTLYAEIGGLTDASLYCGVAGILYKGGAVGLALLLCYLRFLGVKSAPFLILLFLTFSVTLDTLQSFVILGWYYVYRETWFGSALLELFQAGKCAAAPMPAALPGEL